MPNLNKNTDMSGIMINGVFQTWDKYTAKHKKKTRAKNTISQSDKLINRLNAELNMGIPLGMKIRQLNPTRHQLSAGSFKWTFSDNFSLYGSTLSMRELLQAKELEITYTGSAGLSSHPSSLLDIQPTV